MSDMTNIAPRARGLRAEFAVYFAVIFTVALPVAAASWAAKGLRGGNPVARAWSQARVITPTIFSA